MQISQTGSTLYTSKAQQAWEARRAAKASAPQTSAPAAPTTPATTVSVNAPSVSPAPKTHRQTDASPVSAPAQDVMPAMPAHLSSQWAGKVKDIQHVAAQAGFVDVSEQAIRRAYLQGESLLADYRV